MGNFIIPTDFHSMIFQRGRYTTNQSWYWWNISHNTQWKIQIIFKNSDMHPNMCRKYPTNLIWFSHKCLTIDGHGQIISSWLYISHFVSILHPLYIDKKWHPKRWAKKVPGTSPGWCHLWRRLHGRLQRLAQRPGAHADPCREDHHRREFVRAMGCWHYPSIWGFPKSWGYPNSTLDGESFMENTMNMDDD